MGLLRGSDTWHLCVIYCARRRKTRGFDPLFFAGASSMRESWELETALGSSWLEVTGSRCCQGDTTANDSAVGGYLNCNGERNQWRLWQLTTMMPMVEERTCCGACWCDLANGIVSGDRNTCVFLILLFVLCFFSSFCFLGLGNCVCWSWKGVVEDRDWLGFSFGEMLRVGFGLGYGEWFGFLVEWVLELVVLGYGLG